MEPELATLFYFCDSQRNVLGLSVRTQNLRQPVWGFCEVHQLLSLDSPSIHILYSLLKWLPGPWLCSAPSWRKASSGSGNTVELHSLPHPDCKLSPSGTRHCSVPLSTASLLESKPLQVESPLIPRFPSAGCHQQPMADKPAKELFGYLLSLGWSPNSLV